jgi:hypothetical protein
MICLPTMNCLLLRKKYKYFQFAVKKNCAQSSEKVVWQGWEPFRVSPFRMNPAYENVSH